jgi:penicillin-binding protein 2
MRQIAFDRDLRVLIAGGILLLAIMTLVGGLFYHQVLKRGYFMEQSENNRIRIQPTIPKRGLIYDRNLEVIADNRLSFTVSIVPNEKVKDTTVMQLAALLDTDTAAIEKRARNNYIGRYMPAAIRRGLGIDVISVLEEQRRNYPGISYSAESVRHYEEKLSTGTFIGYVGEVSPEEKQSAKYKDYRLGSLIGKKGIEKSYDREMRGIEGTDFIEVSARGQIMGSFDEKENIRPIPGADLILSIDKELQRFAVQTFEEFIADLDTVSCRGAVVAADPNNGEILAMASFPYFDPNIFSGVIEAEEWEAIISDPEHPLLNRPLTGLYPPGSTTKLITAGAALEKGLISAEYFLKPCLGGMRFGNRFFRCWELSGHGKLDLYHSIEQSCDVYFYQVGQMLGVDGWSEYAKQCGFGKATGIDIPGELDGIVASSSYYDKTMGKGKWSPYLVLNLAIGQGEFSITPLQLAQFYCGLANQGRVYRLHLLKEILHPDGTLEKIEPELAFNLPFSRRTLNILNESLHLVVQGKEGTARAQHNDIYDISGKTGTAQNPHGNEHAWFAAFAPSIDPEIVVVVLVEHAGHGSETAAPITCKIMDFYLLEDQAPLAEESFDVKE